MFNSRFHPMRSRQPKDKYIHPHVAQLASPFYNSDVAHLACCFFPNHPVVLGPRFEETAPRVHLLSSSLLPSSSLLVVIPLTRFVAP